MPRLIRLCVSQRRPMKPAVMMRRDKVEAVSLMGGSYSAEMALAYAGSELGYWFNRAILGPCAPWSPR